MSPLTQPSRLFLRKTWAPMDPDAAAYIAAVEQADGQSLEETTKRAIDNFVLGCKADGIWDAIKASCILAGARTLNGALIPLKGTAPTNFNFVSDDYNRKTGLVGDGSTKYLDSNRANNADPQNSKHISVYKNQSSFPSNNNDYIGTTSEGRSFLRHNQNNTFSTLNSAIVSGTVTSTNNTGTFLLGITRSDSANVTTINNRVTATSALASFAPSTTNITVFRGSATSYLSSASQIMFYSIGESIDLARLDARVSDLITTIRTAF